MLQLLQQSNTYVLGATCNININILTVKPPQVFSPPQRFPFAQQPRPFPSTLSFSKATQTSRKPATNVSNIRKTSLQIPELGDNSFQPVFARYIPLELRVGCVESRKSQTSPAALLREPGDGDIGGGEWACGGGGAILAGCGPETLNNNLLRLNASERVAGGEVWCDVLSCFVFLLTTWRR